MDHRALASIARRQDGLLTVEQLMRMGATRDQIDDRVEDLRWQRVHRHVIWINGAPDTPTRRLRAALLALPAAVASHRSAGHLHAFTLMPPGSPTITAPLGSHHVLPGIHVRRSGTMPDHHVVQRSGLRMTSPGRTIVDLAADLDDRTFRRVVEDQLAGRRIDLDDCVAVLAELTVRGRRGIARAHRILLSLDEQPPSESELEARVVDLIERQGLPRPRRQLPLPWADAEAGRVDFAWPDQRVIVEADGRRYHTRIDAFERDRLRDQLATAAGWRPIRFTWRQVVREPRHVETILRRVLG